MTSTDVYGLRPGDRITVSPGAATSGHTHRALTAGFALDITAARPDHHGAIEVYGVELTTRGAWRRGVPIRSVILSPGAYSIPIRVGDSVAAAGTSDGATVAAVHVRADGTAMADLLFPEGDTRCGYNLVDLQHRSRAAQEPTRQRCLRAHAPQVYCQRCQDADEAATMQCDAEGCSDTAVNALLTRRGHVLGACAAHTEQVHRILQDHAATAIALHAGTRECYADGTQVAICRHCGHQIYAYPALAAARRPWRGHQWDETGRCGVAEDRTRIRTRHAPAETCAELDVALAGASCGPTAEQHSELDCPTRNLR
ncbi:hypothetical protein AB0M46_00305 [Dactylosporangium sp. NPDC051485]|uniref:hypothetical protein n=1 Tax=Dactylosporangium sp. NPDC051485 TaxID=3154846 RepID=UPI0034436FFE